MSFIMEKNKIKQHNFMIKEILTECNGKTDKDMIEFLLSDCSEYTIYKYSESNERTLINRINMIWVLPIFILSAPIQWIFTGEVGVSKNSRVGIIVDRLVKFC